MEDRYYFAYGSNMNLEQMKYRCPAAEVVENVRLENYLEIISVFDIVFLSHITYTINTQKSQKRGGVSMATSSITHNFVVSNPNSVKRFVAAIDEADRDRTPKQTLPGRQLTNPQEILALMSKRKRQHV